jgi:DNA-binding CsgD family transcriptional regulator
MQPRDRLTTKEIQVATLVWQGLTNRDIAGVLGTSEQVVKNYLRTAFDKLGVWTRLELALYVASHGGASWHLELGLSPLPPEAIGRAATRRQSHFRIARAKQQPRRASPRSTTRLELLIYFGASTFRLRRDFVKRNAAASAPADRWAAMLTHRREKMAGAQGAISPISSAETYFTPVARVDYF